MPSDRRPLLILATSLLVLVLLVWSCSGPGSGDEAADGEGGETTATTAAESGRPDAPPIVPITGGVGEDGQPEPPPIHAVFSVVVRGSTSWSPYAGPELTGLDEEATRAIAGRLRQIDQLLREAGIPASIELSYGPAAALCAVEPGLLDELEAAGHRIGMHARSTGEAFRTDAALQACGRRATNTSGLASMADPHGPDVPTVQSVVDAMAVLSVIDVHQVVGRVSTLCSTLGLAAATHGYGTGAFTAPWRSGWAVAQPCTDLPSGRIVMIDQNLLVPPEGAERITSAALSTLGTRTDQMLAYALDQRFADAAELPFPGVITWGVTVRLDDLIAPDPEPPDEGETTQPTEPTQPVVPVDPRTAPLSDTTLAELAALAAERWRPSMDRGRLLWMLPDDVGLLLRPLEDTGGDE